MTTFSDLPAFLRERADIIENNLKKEEFIDFTNLESREAISAFFSLMAESFLKD